LCNPGTLKCEPRCTEETEADVCAARERCTAEGRCVECEADTECGPGLVCNAVAGRCAGSETCFSDAECPAGRVCNRATSTCTLPPPPCASDEDCLEDERCDLVRARCVLRACQADLDEPNNRQGDAVRIGAGDRLGLTVCGTDEDWYALPLRRGDRVNVNVEADILVANGLDVQLRDAASRILDEDPLLVDATVAADGDYFLRIRTHDERATYALHVLVARGVPCDDDDREENDSVTHAASIPTGVYRDLQACPADPDWYVVSVPAGKTVDARLTHDPLGGDLDLLLFDGDGATLLRASRTTNPVEEVAVLLHGSRQDREVDLAIVIDGNNTHDGLCMAVTGEQHRPRSDPRGVASVGVRPSVKVNAQPLLEVYMLDFNETIYGRRITVEFLHKLRDEWRFNDLAALTQQIGRDVTEAREYFAAQD
jgi:hypothetical protein